MLIRNFKSVADEVAKRNLANELLQVEISNASILDERISKSKDPNAPPPVPPQFKSNSEIMKDLISLERSAIDGLMDLKFDYSQASQIVQFVRSKGDDILVQFVSLLPQIKADITKKFNPKLITPEFFEGYLNNFFDEVATSFGFKFGNDGGIDVGAISSLSMILPMKGDIATLLQVLEQIQLIPTINLQIEENTNDSMINLTNLFRALPTDNLFHLFQTGIASNDRRKLAKDYNRVIRESHIPSPTEIKQMTEVLLKELQRNASASVFEKLTNEVRSRTSGLSVPKMNKLVALTNDLNTFAGSPEPELLDVTNLPINPSAQPMVLKPETAFDKDDYQEGIIDELMGLSDALKERAIRNAFIKITDTFGDEGADLSALEPEYTDIQDLSLPVEDRVVILANMMRKVMDIQENDYADAKPYKPTNYDYLKMSNKGVTIGFGSKPKSKTAKAVKKHFKEDEKFLKKVAKELEDSSSDEETMKALKKHSKAEKPYEAKIEKAVGAGYIHKRIPIKKIVGKGIEVQEQPTYRTFGKYVMHIPHLTDKNVLNLKYPSLGSIPSIKPMTITDDYKDFIIDVMNTGRPNEKAFNQLNSHEQKHFERITRGAGLIDTFKLKRSGDDEEKKEVDRFNLLRGNYLGGNNSPDVVKELKGLVVKFINDGRIARNEGLNLLMELSI